jgi:hypothetical protein
MLFCLRSPRLAQIFLCDSCKKCCSIEECSAQLVICSMDIPCLQAGHKLYGGGSAERTVLVLEHIGHAPVAGRLGVLVNVHDGGHERVLLCGGGVARERRRVVEDVRNLLV